MKQREGHKNWRRPPSLWFGGCSREQLYHIDRSRPANPEHVPVPPIVVVEIVRLRFTGRRIVVRGGVPPVAHNVLVEGETRERRERS